MFASCGYNPLSLCSYQLTPNFFHLSWWFQLLTLSITIPVLIHSNFNIYAHRRGAAQHNYLLEGGPLVVQASPARWVFLGTHLYQCSSWHCCEKLHLALLNFFWRLFQCISHINAFAHFMMGDSGAYLPSPPYSPDRTPGNFLIISLGEKSSKGNFCQCRRGQTKKWQKH